jgi:anti-sigma28 factor (negative regulator of flagellin synthesis)
MTDYITADDILGELERVSTVDLVDAFTEAEDMIEEAHSVRVAVIREQIKNGTYRLDLDRVAEKMLAAVGRF